MAKALSTAAAFIGIRDQRKAIRGSERHAKAQAHAVANAPRIADNQARDDNRRRIASVNRNNTLFTNPLGLPARSGIARKTLTGQ